MSGYKADFLLFAISLIFFTGLFDDIYGLKAKFKLIAQVTAAIIVCSGGIYINSIAITDSIVLNLGIFSWPFTIFWIVGITNAVNLIDGLDGLAAGISAAACGVIAVLTIHFDIPVMTIIMLSMLGALTGFLLFNFNPAKVFMGDSGSLFLGFTIACSSIFCASKTEAFIGLALPVLALGIPVFDTFFSMLRRFLERRSIFSADRGHFHHRLLALGLCQRHVVIIAYLLTLVITGLGMFMLITRSVQTLIVFVCIMFLLLLVFRVVGAVRLREIVFNLKRKHEIALQTKQEKEKFEQIELYFRDARYFDQWWQAVRYAGEEMGFVKGRMPVINRDGTRRMLEWEQKDYEVSSDLLQSTLAIRDRRAGSPLNLEVHVNTGSSLESAGRRLSLFGRLLEQYSIANLPN
jgi:UDP-N-acetylmuramyl pentapeptide phosphotransferase/UDP-N-acetylglucosamine-1-phosphate transferase